jgi:hypothetical protein
MLSKILFFFQYLIFFLLKSYNCFSRNTPFLNHNLEFAKLWFSPKKTMEIWTPSTSKKEDKVIEYEKAT